MVQHRKRMRRADCSLVQLSVQKFIRFAKRPAVIGFTGFSSSSNQFIIHIKRSRPNAIQTPTPESLLMLGEYYPVAMVELVSPSEYHQESIIHIQPGAAPVSLREDSLGVKKNSFTHCSVFRFGCISLFYSFSPSQHLVAICEMNNY